MKAAELLASRREEFARLISAESGLFWKDAIYEATRAYDVWSFAPQLTIRDDGEQFSCDISPNGKARKIFTTRVLLLGVISAITPFNHPLNMVSHGTPPRARCEASAASPELDISHFNMDESNDMISLIC